MDAGDLAMFAGGKEQEWEMEWVPWGNTTGCGAQ